MELNTFKIFIIFTLVLSVTLSAGSQDSNTIPTRTISMIELKDHVNFLASDELKGRVAGSDGYKKAAQYAADQLKKGGLKPIIKDSKGKMSFFQEVPLYKKTFKNNAMWTLQVNSEIIKAKPGVDIKSAHLGYILQEKARDFYFVGYGISEPEHNWDDIKGTDLSDKTVVVMMGTPKTDGHSLLPAKLDKKYAGIMGIDFKLNKLKKHGASSFLLLSSPELEYMWKNIADPLSEETISNQKEKKTDNNKEFIGVASKKISSMIMKHQKYNPYANTEGKYQIFPVENVSLKLEAEEINEVVLTWNILGIIPGKDKILNHELIVLGGHLDHIPPLNGEICNGADDNASGSSGVIEIAEALVDYNNKRSILVCLWGAEELGLFGSKYFLANPPVDIKNIKVHINLDMIARSDEDNKANRAIYALGTSEASENFKSLILKVNSASVNWPLNFNDEAVGLGGSDHVGFMDKGIPSLFFFSGLHKDYHKPTDDAENLDWEKFYNVSLLARDLVKELANTEQDLDSLKKTTAKKVES
jgi:hypothetical protein